MPPRPDNHLSLADVERLASLARLSLSDHEAHDMLASLGSILSHITILQAADLSAAEPLASPLDATAIPQPDTPGPTLPQRTIADLTPHHSGPFITIPKVLDGGDSSS